MNCLDCLLRVSTTEDLNQEPEILEWSVQGGGKVATAMVAASLLGATTSILTMVGDDEAGDYVISDFERYGVNISRAVTQERGKTNIYFILVDSRSGVGKWVKPDVIRDWGLPQPIARAIEWAETPQSRPFRTFTSDELHFVTQGKILHVDGFLRGDCLKATRIAQHAGVPTCYDMYSHPDIVDLLANITYCIPSRKAAMNFTGVTDPKGMCETLLRYGPQVAGVTLGEEGSVFMSATEYVVRGAFKVPVVDTTGAGDVFHGAFCYGVANRWQLVRTIEFSSAVSALKCTKLGGRAGIPTYALVDKFLEENVEEIRKGAT